MLKTKLGNNLFFERTFPPQFFQCTKKMFSIKWDRKHIERIKSAFEKNNKETIFELLKEYKPAEIKDYEDSTLIHLAVKMGDWEIIRYLISKDCCNLMDILCEIRDSPLGMNICDEYLHYLTRNAYIFETFLKHKPTLEKFNTDGAIENYMLFSNVDSSIIRLLLTYKVSLRTKDRHGNTILHFIVYNRDREVANLIMKSEIDANIKGVFRRTPLHHVIGLANIECLKALISKGADVNVENEFGEISLIISIDSYAHKEEIDILLESGTILDEEIQNKILKKIVARNVCLSKVSSIFKRMAIMHFQVEALSRRNLNIIRSNSNLDLLFALYFSELNSMKQTEIMTSSNISVFDILCASEQKLLNLARNNEMVLKFHEINVDTRYQNFGELVKKQFESAQSKQNLIQNAMKVLTENIKQLNFNIEVTENIVKFLSPDDLVTLDVKECF